MTWMPPDEQSSALLQQILARAHEQVLVAFGEQRQRIERQQAAAGVLGGAVLARCDAAAETALRGFGRPVVLELLDSLNDVCAGPPSPDALQWARAMLQSHIDELITDLSEQIDGLKTGGGVQGAAGRLGSAGTAAKRDIDIEINRAGIRFRSAPPAVAAPAQVGARIGPGHDMYSLLVSSDSSAWSGAPFSLAKDRFLEYTDEQVRKVVGDFSESAIASLVRLPCIFAYENICKKDPVFGVVRRIIPRERDVRVEYELVSVTPFLNQEQFVRLGAYLGISDDFEFHRTHWAVKEINLARALQTVGVTRRHHMCGVVRWTSRSITLM